MYNYLFPSVIAAVGWGITPIIDRYGMKHIEKFNYTSLKLFFFGFFGLIYIIYNFKNIISNIKEAESLRIFNIKYNPIINALLSGFISSIALIFYYSAISNIKFPIINVTLVSYTMPIIVLTLLSYIFLNEKINLKMVVGVIITFIGLYITITNNENKK